MSLSLPQIARALGGEVTGGQVLAPGPGHSARDRSMAVKVSPIGKLLVNSHAGDDALQCLSYVESKLGFKWEPGARAASPASPNKPAQVAQVSNVDASRSANAIALWHEAGDPRGTLAETYLASRGLVLPDDVALAVIRFHPSCPFGQGERHPCLVAAFRSIATGDVVAIHRTALTAEGRKIDRKMLGPVAGAAIMLAPLDAERGTLCVGEGLESALSGMGMGFSPAWAMGSADAIAKLPVLAGVETLTILGEHDASGTSARTSADCARRWSDAGREVFIAKPKAGLGDDANDAWQAGQGAADVLDVVAFGAEPNLDAPPATDPDLVSSPAPAITATPFVLADPGSLPTRKWLYGRHYIRRFVSATIAPGGVGKSSLGMVEALAMVTGLPLLGERSASPLRVWLWNGEDPREELERRLAGACLHFDIAAADIGGRLFVDSGRDLPIRMAEAGAGGRIMVATPTIEGVEAAIKANKIDLLIIDPFVSSHGVPENDNGAIDRVAKIWAGIAERCNCAIELVHHVRKGNGGEGGYSVEDARGGSSLIGAVRSARVLNPMSKEEAERAGVEPAHRRLHFRVDDGKANMAPPLEKAAWRRMVGVGLGNGNGREPEDNVGVATAWEMPGVLDDVTVQHLDRVLAMVRADPTYRLDMRAANWIGQAVAEVLGLDIERKADKEQARRVLRIWIENGALATERRPDKNREMREFITVGPNGNP